MSTMEMYLITSIAIATVVFFHFKFIATRKTSKRNLPPEPWGLPIIGHMHHLIGTLPHRGITNLARKYGTFLHLRFGEVSTIVVSSPKLAKEVLTAYDLTFADRPHNLTAEIVVYHSTDIIFSPYGEYWRQLRRLCTTELLSVKKVKSFRSLREEESWYLVQDIRSSGSERPINLSYIIFSRMAVIISRAAFGKGLKDPTEFIDLIKRIVTEMGGFDVADIFPSKAFIHHLSGKRSRLAKIHNRVENVVNKILAESLSNRSNTSDESLLDILLRLKDGIEFPLTIDNVKAVILDVFGVGADTSAATIEWALSEVIRSPRVLEKLQTELRQVLNGKEKIQEEDIQDLSYLNQVIKETLRLHPPIPLVMPREARETCVLAGYDIPKKTKLIINVFAINRDPEYWNDPESFIPERFENNPTNILDEDYEYLPFGARRRMCPGIGLGLANIRLPLANILYNFNWKLPDGEKNEDLDMSECFGAAVHRKYGLILVPSF
ncbi:germacrene A hydroxylase [Lactuca sativa]|uniref:germacrene A hydroxylase n=1 Tax=Lactuca sativa TaxID=4236 RepID=UPI000CD97DFF|nr:germacrene A hydroxylase [Lactuca sativa]